MNNKIIPLIILLVTQYISGCSSDANSQTNDTENEFSEVEFEETRSYQTDIFHQKTEVINDPDSYNNVWLSLPSLSHIPDYDSDLETMIIVLSPSPSCGFHHEVESAYENTETISINIVQIPFPDQPACDALPFPIYGFNAIKIPKTDKLINVIF